MWEIFNKLFHCSRAGFIPSRPTSKKFKKYKHQLKLSNSKEILASFAVSNEASNEWFLSIHKVLKSSIKFEEGATMAYSFTDGGVNIFPAWSPREWHSVCFVFKNQNMTLYIDKKVVTKTIFGNFKVYMNNC